MTRRPTHPGTVLRTVVDFDAAKKGRERKRYAELVMKTFDDMEHADKRAVLDKKAEVQIAARERL